ncbi:MAG: GntR family transcriptional regulator [Alphaproteobacteria bacterium]|jgi:DNA-binding GntR family transcriptional regulator|nr:GntR family transcriptional regulator [Alphaproteobacteria bacterium]MBT7942712.1 GntR family transcriptional regulator [Alphaproteobacteria bacterium]
MPKKTSKTPVIKKGADSSLGEYVQVWLRDAIREGQYPPGSRIREAEVAERLDVSRTPVREAFGRLQADGLLILTPWRGAQVAELDRNQIVELYAMRRALEGTAAALAAQHASKAEIDLLFDLLEQDKDGNGDALRHADLNRQFHQALYGAGHNRYLLKALNALGDSLSLLKSTTYEVSGRATTARAQHVSIAEAIKKHDSDAAEKAARAHIESAERARIQLLFGEQ